MLSLGPACVTDKFLVPVLGEAEGVISLLTSPSGNSRRLKRRCWRVLSGGGGMSLGLVSFQSERPINTASIQRAGLFQQVVEQIVLCNSG